MSEPTYRNEYLSYIAANPNVKPFKNFFALGTVADKPPTFFNSLPLGEVFVYPQFLIFLTLIEGKAGTGMLFSRLVEEELKPLYNLQKWVNNPATIILDAAKWLSKTFQDKDRLAQALENPNSIFVPFDKIKSVEAGRYLSQGNFIKIKNPTRTVLICQSMTHENLFSSGASYLTGNWQSDVLAKLKSAAK